MHKPTSVRTKITKPAKDVDSLRNIFFGSYYNGSEKPPGQSAYMVRQRLLIGDIRDQLTFRIGDI